MKRTIEKCFLQRKADRTERIDEVKCKKMRFDLIVSRVMLFVFLSLSFSTLNATLRITETRYDIEGVETGQQGTYLVKVYVYSKKNTVTIEEFKYAAVHGVIFRGFSGRGGAQKPFAKIAAQTQYADFFNAFFNNGDYATYAQVVNPVADRVKVGNEYKIAAIVSVAKDELRETLETAGVIHSLNSGF